MAVRLITSTPHGLLAKFRTAVTQTESEGKITTWELSDDGVFYTHKAAQWNKKAWFKPSVMDGQLTFNILRPKNANVNTVVYGYYHGHLIETFLNHFEREFSSTQATALAQSPDNCSGA